MNIALCFYGQPRFYGITFHNYFNHILEKYNPDVFIHTWWSKNMVGSLYPCAPWAIAALSEEDRIVKNSVIDDLIKFYNPKKIKYDDYNLVNIKHHKPNYYQYYTQYAVKELLTQYELEKEIEYDLVIRARFDLLIRQNIPYQIDNNLWISNSCPHHDKYNDLFTFSNSKNYKKISDAYLNLEEFESEYDAKYTNKGNAEWPFTKQILKENIPIKLFEAEYNTFDICRTETANLYR